jgi:hypothetical protein
MDVVGHDREAVELETVLIAMLEERCDEEFGVGCALEVAMSLEGQDCDCVCALLLADCGHGRKAPGAKALSWLGLKRAKPKGLAYLEATATTLASWRFGRPNECGSRSARMLPHAMRLYEWGTRASVVLLVGRGCLNLRFRH